MSDAPLERGDGVKALWEDGYLILWDGTPDGWLRCRPPIELEYWR